MTDERRQVEIESLTQRRNIPETLITNDPYQWRANLKAIIAGRLALGIWLLIGLIALFHLISVTFI